LAGHAGEAQVLSAGQPMSDASDPRLREANLICLSLVGTSTPARIRYLVRRLRRRAPGAHVIVGFWGVPQEGLTAAREMIDASISSPLREAVGLLPGLGSAANNADFLNEPHPCGIGEGVPAG
jgi:hypothetical protein